MWQWALPAFLITLHHGPAMLGTVQDSDIPTTHGGLQTVGPSASTTVALPTIPIPKRGRGRPRKLAAKAVSAEHDPSISLPSVPANPGLPIVEQSVMVKLEVTDSSASRPKQAAKPQELDANVMKIEHVGTSTMVPTTEKFAKKSPGQLQTWKVIPPNLGQTSRRTPNGTLQSTLDREIIRRPRIWTSDRGELVASVPALGPAKSTNGVSWTHTKTPMILLDDPAKGTARNIEMVRCHADAEHVTTFDLILTRTLVPAASSVKANVAPAFEALSAATPAFAHPPLFLSVPSGAVKRVGFGQEFGLSQPPLTSETLGNHQRERDSATSAVRRDASGNKVPENTSASSLAGEAPITGIFLTSKDSYNSLMRIADRFIDPNRRMVQLMEGVRQNCSALVARIVVPPSLQEDPDGVVSELAAGVAAMSLSLPRTIDLLPVFSPTPFVGGGTYSAQTEFTEIKMDKGTDYPRGPPLPTLPVSVSAAAVTPSSLSVTAASSPLKGGHFPCRCHKCWVYVGCKEHAVIRAPPLFRTEETREYDGGDGGETASRRRPKRKAAAVQSTQTQPPKRMRWTKEEMREAAIKEGILDRPEQPVESGIGAEQGRGPVVAKQASKERKGKSREEPGFSPIAKADAGESLQRKRARPALPGDGNVISTGVVGEEPPRKRLREASSPVEELVVPAPPGEAARKILDAAIPSPRHPLRAPCAPGPVGAGFLPGEDPEIAREEPTTAIPLDPGLSDREQLVSVRSTGPLPSLPSEVRALIDAFISGTPLVVLASRSRILELFATSTPRFGVPEESGFACLGFFRIIGLEEGNLPALAGPQTGGIATLASVQWRFRVEWVKGGEAILNHSSQDLSRPWWASPSHHIDLNNSVASPPFPIQNIKEATDSGASPSSDKDGRHNLDIPSLYLELRKAHRNHDLQDTLIASSLFSLIPQTLLSEFNSFLSNDGFPSGWFCDGCGKINFQAAMRHRKCTSKQCSDDGKPCISFAQDLADIRGPHNGSPCCLPFNDYSQSVLGTSIAWNNGMRTMSYYFDGKKGPRKTWVKHVFTCNLAHLQGKASEMVKAIQQEVELRRPMGDTSNPFFTYAQDLVSSNPGVDKPDEALPQSLGAAAKFIATRASSYGGVPPGEIEISRLRILAWITPGTKKNQDILWAKKNTIAVLCLGCDIVVCITPKKTSDIVASTKAPRKASKKGNEVPLEADVDIMDTPEDIAVAKEEDLALTATEKDSHKLPEASSSQLPAVTPSLVLDKLPDGSVRISMVHGDVLVLSGEDFTYSLKRSGTGILVFGMKAT